MSSNNTDDSGNATSTMSLQELETTYKKALKNLEGEKRAAIKKAKGTKGKKAKDAVAQVEADFETKLKLLQTQHEEKVQNLQQQQSQPSQQQKASSTVGAVENQPAANTKGDPTTGTNDSAKHVQEKQAEVDLERQRKQERARRKKEKQREKELQKQRELEEEEANAGPSRRAIELEQIQAVLDPLKLQIKEVTADGHCLYRAIAAQCNNNDGDSDRTYADIRALCADTLQANQEEFEPFCEYTDTITDFQDYVDQVRNSAEWGGHLELRALGMALQRPIHVYSVQSGTKPLEIHHPHEEEGDSLNPIRLSYHLHYYALGEHYNQIVPLQ